MHLLASAELFRLRSTVMCPTKPCHLTSEEIPARMASAVLVVMGCGGGKDYCSSGEASLAVAVAAVATAAVVLTATAATFIEVTAVVALRMLNDGQLPKPQV